VTAQVHARRALTPGVTVTGPAVILEDGTTTVVPTGRTARIGADREIVIEGSLA
jgi:N-methylhydantoinase A